MRLFTLLLDPEGQGIGDEVRRAYEAMPRRRRFGFAWQAFDHAAVLTAWDDPRGDPLVARDGNHIGVGMVRLDNRPDLERWAECKDEELTALALVLRVVARYGSKYIPQFLGDFAFVVWDGSSRIAISACDVFAVKRVYYAERNGLFAFASRAESLALEARYEVEYLLKLVASHGPPLDRTVYAGVRPVPAACMAVLRQRRLSLSQYWNAADIQAGHACAQSEIEAVQTCRRLLAESVCLRLGAKGETWAQLSGGLDSSSVVSLTQWLAERGDVPHGLAGTITFVDRAGTGADEREYSDAVVSRWGLKSEVIINPPTWHDKRFTPPLNDQPDLDISVYPRDRQLCAIMQAAGGRVLLTGWGGDQLFMGSMLFFADWLADGRMWPAFREMARRAAIGRISFWTLAYKNALLPLLPQAAQRRLVREDGEIRALPWLHQATMRQYGLTTQSAFVTEYSGPVGHKYEHAVAARVSALGQLTIPGLVADTVDVRHPLLYRPLLEFTLQMPPELRARPYAHRWVLREAMKGILPDKVRTRVGKQDTGESLAWTLATQRASLIPLLQKPILAELGILDAERLRAAFDATATRTGRGECMHAQVLSTLAVEAWLQMRSGRWPRGGHTSSAESRR